jgi:hypothetical protein
MPVTPMPTFQISLIFWASSAVFPLSPVQRQRIATQTAADLRANPASVQSTDDTVRKLLAKVNVGDASAVAERRETFRLQTATLPASNVGHAVVESNDPDRQHQRLITERSLYLSSAPTDGSSLYFEILTVPGPTWRTATADSSKAA